MEKKQQPSSVLRGEAGMEVNPEAAESQMDPLENSHVRGGGFTRDLEKHGRVTYEQRPASVSTRTDVSAQRLLAPPPKHHLSLRSRAEQHLSGRRCFSAS